MQDAVSVKKTDFVEKLENSDFEIFGQKANLAESLATKKLVDLYGNKFHRLEPITEFFNTIGS